MAEYIARNIDSELTAWKEDSMRKPLLLRGARQVGKSSAVKNFGKQFRYFAEVNFERNKAIKTFFQGDIDVRLIAKKISSYINVPIEAGKTKDRKYKQLCKNKKLVDGYIRAVSIMYRTETTRELREYSFLHYERLAHDPRSSIRIVNGNVERLLFAETEDGVEVELIEIDSTHYGNKK